MDDLFLNDNYCLTNPIAQRLYHEYGEEQPIMDYHCHLDPKEIYENQPFENITQAWLSGDHYKWRLMRANGVPEECITGDAPDYQKFLSFATALEKAAGNPVYLWTHLEMKRLFDISLPLNKQTAPILWEQLNQKIAQEDFLPRELIKKFKVQALCTTDDPLSDLKYHKLLQSEETFQVLPTFRPDKFLDMHSPFFSDYVEKLSIISELSIHTYHDLLRALEKRIDYFSAMGCKLSDHSFAKIVPSDVNIGVINAIFSKKMSEGQVSEHEAEAFEFCLLRDLIKLYDKKNWTVQLHLSATRNNNQKLYHLVGADSGGDAIGEESQLKGLTALLNSLNQIDALPKMILYSLNANDLAGLTALIGCFQGGTRSKLQVGAAWWFNDTYSGMRKQLTAVAEGGLLGNFVGMLTDSRSLLSYPRHEYFRRILCQLLSEWVLAGQLSSDWSYLEQIITDISYQNAKEYFGFANVNFQSLAIK